MTTPATTTTTASGVTLVTSAATRTTRPIDYDPARFDGAAYAARALAHARAVAPDAVLVGIEVNGVAPTGLADLRFGDAEYDFRSPARSTLPADLPRNVTPEVACYVTVTASARALEIRVRDHSGDARCRAPARPLPACSLARVWDAARREGAAVDTIAKVSLLALDGTWWFDNQDEDGQGVATSFPASICR